MVADLSEVAFKLWVAAVAPEHCDDICPASASYAGRETPRCCGLSLVPRRRRAASSTPETVSSLTLRTRNSQVLGDRQEEDLLKSKHRFSLWSCSQAGAWEWRKSMSTNRKAGTDWKRYFKCSLPWDSPEWLRLSGKAASFPQTILSFEIECWVTDLKQQQFLFVSHLQVQRTQNVFTIFIQK